jgi:hypothetical protein
MFNHDYIILHKSEKTNQSYSVICNDPYWHPRLVEGKNWQSEFLVFNVNTNQSTIVSLAISTFDCGNELGPCSNINQFTKAVKDFVQGNSTTLPNNNDAVVTDNSASNQQSSSSTKKKKSFFGSSDNTEDKLKVVRAKERNPSNNQPVSIDVYDKSLSLKVGDNIIVTRTDEVKIPGEKKTIKSETTIGKAKITEDFSRVALLIIEETTKRSKPDQAQSFLINKGLLPDTEVAPQ